MATRENAATAKANTPTPSTVSILRADAPQVRTVEAILRKNEQILDGMETGRVTPKAGEQMQQCLKTPERLANLELKFFKFAAAMGRKVPVPRSAILRNILGLPANVTAGDGAQVRALIAEQDAE